MKDLDVSTRDKLDATFREARSQLESGKKDQAVSLARQAWEQLPSPKFDWDVSKSYAHAIAVIYRDTGHYDLALAVMNDLFSSGTVKPYQDRPHFVLGTIYLDMGDLENARKHLQEANRISKGRSFQGEPSKYKDAIN